MTKRGSSNVFSVFFVFDIFRDEIQFPLLIRCSSTIEVHIFQQIVGKWITVCSLHLIGTFPDNDEIMSVYVGDQFVSWLELRGSG